MVDYEKENALEWATREEVAAYYREKQQEEQQRQQKKQHEQEQQQRQRQQQPHQQPAWSHIAGQAPGSVVQKHDSAQTNAEIAFGLARQPPPVPQFSYASAAGRGGTAVLKPPQQLGPQMRLAQRSGREQISGYAEQKRAPQQAGIENPLTATQNTSSIPTEGQVNSHHSADRAPGPRRPQRKARAGPSEAGKFPKVRPENDNFGKDAAAQKREAKRQMAMIEASASCQDEFGHHGIFILGDEVAAKPETILRTLKELGQHRRCNISHSRTNPTIQVIAPELQTVQLVLSRTRGMVLNAANAQEHIHMIFVDRPAHGVILSDGWIRRASAWNTDARPKAAGLEEPPNTDKMLPIMERVPRHKVDFSAEQRNTLRNILAFQTGIAKALERLVGWKGAITMRINFGAVTFLKYQWSQGEEGQETAKFIENLQQPSTVARLYRVMPEENLFRRLTGAAELLAPYRSGEVQETMPSYVGFFVWKKGSESQIYEVRTEPVNAETGAAPQVVHRGWMAPDAPGTESPLSLFLTQLNGGLSCVLQIHRARVAQSRNLPQLPTARVTSPLACADYKKAAARGELMFDWRPSGCNSFRQRIIYRFRVRGHLDYILDLIRYDTYSHRLDQFDRVPVETRWDATLYHEDWEEKFANNISLKPGEKAYWSPSVEEFFPSHGTDADGEAGIAPGFAGLFRWIGEFLDIMNAKERESVWGD